MGHASALCLSLAVAVSACSTPIRGGAQPNSAGTDPASGTGGTPPSSTTGTAPTTTTTPTGTTPFPGACSTPNAGSTPMRRLNALQYANTVKDVLGVSVALSAVLAEDEKVGPFNSNLLSPVGELHVDRYMSAAELVAANAIGQLSTVLPCDPAATGEAACAETFLTQTGARLFRRPLEDQERVAYLGLYGSSRTAGRSFSDGISLLVRVLLQSPAFLYQVETAPAGAPTLLSGNEVATRLASFLWSSAPDVALESAAMGGQLTTVDGLLTQARRLLSDPHGASTLASFHSQWLKIDRLPALQKDSALTPRFDAALGQAMLSETEHFADWVIRSGDGSMKSLFTQSSSFLDGALFDVYGLPKPAKVDQLIPVALKPSERSGLLTQASFLTAHSHFGNTSPVLRGVVVLDSVLCKAPPPPPPTVMTVPPAPIAGETTRERFDRHRTDPTCASCHSLMDPIGYGFAHYDALGRYITDEGGKPIDASGEIKGTQDIDGPFNGAIELSQRLSGSNQVQDCMVSQWFSFALGRNLDKTRDACSLQGVKTAFAASDYNLRELLFAIVKSDAFRYRASLEGGAP